MKHPLVHINDIPETGSTLVDFFGRTVHIYKVDGKPRAVANVCMHFGGPLEYNAEECTFSCPWHNTKYDARDGTRLEGPAPRQNRLMVLSTVVENGVLTYVWGE